MTAMKSDGFKSSCLPTSHIFGIVVTSLIFVFGAICADTAAPKVEETTAMQFPIDCRPFHMRSMKFLLKNFNKCSRELKANSTTDKEYEENMGCAMKCTMKATGYSINDIVTIDTIRAAAAKLLPVGLVEPVVQTLVTKCHEKMGHKLDPAEPQCRSYSEYAFCIQNTIGDLVDSEYCIKFDKKGGHSSR